MSSPWIWYKTFAKCLAKDGLYLKRDGQWVLAYSTTSPSSAPGIESDIGSLCVAVVGGAPTLYIKSGSGDTDWTAVGTVPTYANFAALPSGAADGQIGITLDDHSIYIYDLGATLWKVLASIGSDITSLNGLTASTQTFSTGTTGTDFAISSATSTHTFNLPTASATNRGALSTADWSTFNGKQAAIADGSANQTWGMNAAGNAKEWKTLSIGTTGTDFAIAHAANSIAFNLPTSSDTNRGALASADFKTFSYKGDFAGSIQTPVITDLGTGNITTNTINVYLRSSSDSTAPVQKYTLTGLTNQSLTDNTTNYLVADYNSGTPIQKVITNVLLINENNVCPLATIYRNGTTLHTLNWDSMGLGLAGQLHYATVKTQRYRREYGLEITESGTRNLTISDGIIFVGGCKITLDQVASLTDNMYFNYHVTSAWTVSSITAYNNSQYDNGTDLVTLTNNRYAVNWIYRGVETQKHVYVVLGTGDYTLAEAQASQPPSLPSLISSHATLIGRVIVKKGDSTATQIDSAFSTTFSPSAVSNHGDLAGRDATTQHPIAALYGTAANRIPYQNAGNTALEDNENLTYVSGTGLNVADTTDATSSTDGAIKTAGGLGVAKKLFVGTTAKVGTYLGVGANSVVGTAITAKSSQSTTSAIGVSSEPVQTGAFLILNFNAQGSFSNAAGTDSTGYKSNFPNLYGTSTLQNYYGFRSAATSDVVSGTKRGLDIGNITGGLTNYSIYTGTAQSYFGGVLTVADTTASTSSTTGALIVAGGVGIGENLWVGGLARYGSTPSDYTNEYFSVNKTQIADQSSVSIYSKITNNLDAALTKDTIAGRFSLVRTITNDQTDTMNNAASILARTTLNIPTGKTLTTSGAVRYSGINVNPLIISGGGTFSGSYASILVAADSTTVSGTKYGLLVNNISGATTNYSIATGTAQCYWGGDTTTIGQQKLKDGTKTSPSMSFTSDADTGWFWTSSGKISYSSNDTLIMSLPTAAPTAGQVLKANATTPTNLEWGTGGGWETATFDAATVTIDAAIMQKRWVYNGTTDRTITLTDGTPIDAKVIRILNTAAAGSLTMVNSANTLLNGDWSAGQGGMIELMYSSLLSKWVEITRNSL